MNVVGAFEKIGINALTLSAGEGKDEMNPFRNWKPEEEKQYQSLINFYYDTFVDIVAQDRSIPRETLVKNLGAKVFPAPEAASLGLINESGFSRNQVLTTLAQEAGITGKYQVVGFESESWWKKLFKEQTDSPVLKGTLKHEMGLPFHNGNPFSYLFRP
jgi:ClpP class serine protease